MRHIKEQRFTGPNCRKTTSKIIKTQRQRLFMQIILYPDLSKGNSGHFEAKPGAKLRFFELAHVEEKERRLRLSWNKMISKIIKTGHLQILIQKDFVFRPFQEDKKSFFGQFGGRLQFF